MIAGCCCQSCRVSLPPVDQWENITTVHAYPGNADETPIAPYARGWYVYQSGSCILERDEPNATCGRNDGTQGVCYDMNFDGTSGSSNWLAAPEGITECTAGVDETVSVMDLNCYRKTGEQIDFSHACTPGWKGVCAEAVWPGRFGFIDGGDECCPDETPQSRFTSISMSVVMTNEEKRMDHGTSNLREHYTHASDWSQVASVDAHGNVTRTGNKHWSADIFQDGAPDFTYTYDGCDDDVFEGNRNRGDDYFVSQPPSLFAGSITRAHVALTTVRVECGVITMLNYLGNEEFTGTISEFEAYWSDYFQQAADQLNDHPTFDGLATASVSASLSNSRLSLTGTYSATMWDTGDWDYTTEAAINFVLELAGEITFQSVMEDCIALLDTWPLHDDAVYPWRSDAQTWLMPYVQRDAAAVAPTISWATDENCEFFSEVYYSGEIRGAPLPAGYSGHFDFNHVNWMRTEDSGTCNGCEDSLGAAQASPVPATATRWTDYNTGSSMTGPGAHVQQRIDANYSTGSPGSVPIPGVRMQKWVETLERWPSANFLRPFGDDRWRMEMDTAVCISSVTGTTVEMNASLSGVSAGELVVFYGGTLTGQVWTVASNSGTTLTLGTQFDPSPAGTVETLVAANMDEWANHGTWGPDGTVGKLRWQAAARPHPRVTGKDLNITVDPVDTYKITLPENQIVSGDAVIVLNGGTQVGSTMYFKRITDTTGELYTDSGLTTPASATGANKLRGYETSYIDQVWNTDASRNTVVLRDFDSQFREADADPMLPLYDTTLTQYTLTRSNTKQCVFCASPNSQDTDYFSGNGSGSIVVTWDSGRVAADMCFGEEWHTDVVQTMADPLWQRPNSPCDTSAQDDYPCEEGANQYHYPALVEPLMAGSLPGGAPTIPGATWFDEDGAAPTAVGTAFCVSIPRDRGTAHNIRTAWEGCQNQKDQRNHGL